MVYDGSELPHPRAMASHYYGDTVRILLIISAVFMLIAASMGANLPLSLTGTVITVMILVIAAGITNPAQFWIHMVNAFIIVVNAVIFSVSAIEHYQNTATILDSSYFFIEVLALLFLVSLYYAVKTIRGFVLR